MHVIDSGSSEGSRKREGHTGGEKMTLNQVGREVQKESWGAGFARHVGVLRKHAHELDRYPIGGLILRPENDNRFLVRSPLSFG